MGQESGSAEVLPADGHSAEVVLTRGQRELLWLFCLLVFSIAGIVLCNYLLMR